MKHFYRTGLNQSEGRIDLSLSLCSGLQIFTEDSHLVVTSARDLMHVSGEGLFHLSFHCRSQMRAEVGDNAVRIYGVYAKGLHCVNALLVVTLDGHGVRVAIGTSPLHLHIFQIEGRPPLNASADSTEHHLVDV